MSEIWNAGILSDQNGILSFQIINDSKTFEDQAISAEPIVSRFHHFIIPSGAKPLSSAWVSFAFLAKPISE